MKGRVAILILLLILFPNAENAYAGDIPPAILRAETAYAADMPPAVLKVSRVFGNTAKPGMNVPLRVEIYGQASPEFNGTLTVTTMENREDGVRAAYGYEYPVTVGMSETLVKEIYVPYGMAAADRTETGAAAGSALAADRAARGMTVTLTDGNGRVCGEQTLAFDGQLQYGKLVIGALSDSPEMVAYLNGVSLGYGLARAELSYMDNVTLPEDAKGLEAMDALIIDDFATDTLSGGRQRAILSWVRDGGLLLFGTGEHAQKTMGGFAAEFAEAVPGSLREESLNMGPEYSDTAPRDSYFSVKCVTLSVPGGRTRIESDGTAVLLTVGYGEGTIGFFTFSLGGIKDFALKHPEYPSALLMSLFGDAAISQIYYDGVYGQDGEYWNAQSMANGGGAGVLPNLSVYAVLIAAYLVLAGPVSYLVLKKKDLSRFYAPAVICLSAVFAAAVWLAGCRTRFTKEFYSCATILDRGDGAVSETTYLNAMSPDGRRFDIEIPSGYEIRPLTRGMNYGEGKNVATIGDTPDGRDVTVKFASHSAEGTKKDSIAEDAITLEFGNSRAFMPRFFSLRKKSEETDYGEAGQDGFFSDLRFQDGRLYGSVMNGYPFALEHSALIFYGRILQLGTLDAGETRRFYGTPLLTYPPDYGNLLARSLSGTQGADSSGSALTAVYDYCVSKYFSSYTPQARLVAVGGAGGLEAYLRDTGKTASGITVYTCPLDVSWQDGGLIYRNGLAIKPAAMTRDGTPAYSAVTMYSMEPLTVEYSFGDDIDVEEVTFLEISQEFLEDPAYSYLRRFDGRVYFYNNEAGIYDEVSLGRESRFTSEQLEPYLTNDNKLTVRYVEGGNNQATYSLALPLPMVTGRVN